MDNPKGVCEGNGKNIRVDGGQGDKTRGVVGGAFQDFRVRREAMTGDQKRG